MNYNTAKVDYKESVSNSEGVLMSNTKELKHESQMCFEHMTILSAV